MQIPKGLRHFGISRQNSRDIPAKRFGCHWASRERASFFTPAPSRGRPPLHLKISGLRRLILIILSPVIPRSPNPGRALRIRKKTKEKNREGHIGPFSYFFCSYFRGPIQGPGVGFHSFFPGLRGFALA